MWHFCLVLDPLHLCAEREFDTSRGGYTPLKWPLGQARDEKKNLGPGPGLRLPTHISTASLLDQRFQAALQGSGSGERPPPPPPGIQRQGYSPRHATHRLCVLGGGLAHGWTPTILCNGEAEDQCLPSGHNDPEFERRGLISKTTLKGKAVP